MKTLNKKLQNLLFVLIALLAVSCTATKPMNDFFGIEMAQEDAQKFIIYSYSEEDGTSYQATMNMNPKIYAYASFNLKTIDIKVINSSDKMIKSNFFTDQFCVYTKSGKKFMLLKGFWEDYPTNTEIEKDETIEFSLQTPQPFLDEIGNGFYSEHSDRYHFEVPFKGRKATQEIIKFIDYLVIKLNNETVIILKPIKKEKVK